MLMINTMVEWLGNEYMRMNAYFGDKYHRILF